MSSSLDSSSVFTRPMGQGELSYFLPSRADGVNDMYLHLGFQAPATLITRDNILTLWALLRIRHPLLQSTVDFRSYSDVRFSYRPPKSPAEALQTAKEAFSYVRSSKDDLISSYLNGPRTLGSDHLSHLFLSSPYAPAPLVSTIYNSQAIKPEELADGTKEVPLEKFDILIAATHYLGDGMALHNFANDFFTLLSQQHVGTQTLSDMLTAEWQKRCAPGVGNRSYMLPHSLEARLPSPGGKCKQALAKGEFQNSQRKIIGGHILPKSAQRSSRHTIVPTISFSPERTQVILKKCKVNGVSISNAIFALCALVWARMERAKGNLAKPELPIMFYSALNMRPYVDPLNSKALVPERAKQDHDSYWFLAVGYFNVVLPSFLPNVNESRLKEAGQELATDESTTLGTTFWARARSAKVQSTKAAKSPFVVSRSHAMSNVRGERAIQWAKEDDEKASGTWKPKERQVPKTTDESQPQAPSEALLGLSLLGNLDGIYKHATYAPASIYLHTLTTGSRQRAGAMLLFGYTFAGKLWLSLGYDENGFVKEVVNKFWTDLGRGVEEFLEA